MNPTAKHLSKGQDNTTESFASLFEESNQSGLLQKNHPIQGKVIQVTKDFVVVDVGYKSEGQVPIAEFISPEGDVTVKPGDMVEVVLKRQEGDNGLCVLSKRDADALKAWEGVAVSCENDELVDGIVTQRVKGGLEVLIRGSVKAFLPGSQVDLRPVRSLDSFLGKTFKFKVIKFSRKGGNIVLSRRALLEKERADLKESTLSHLSEGQVVEGIVKNLTEYGAFVDLGGLDGLVHITDMSWSRVNHPSDMVKVGDRVKVKVLKYNSGTERISLGIKQLTDDPWVTIQERYQPGTVVRGRVIALKDYGAFLELEDGVEGLVHISEMSWTRRVKHPSKVVALGDTVEAVVLDVDMTNRRISLGMKQLEPNPYESLMQKYPVGSRVKGKVRSITDFGLFVEIDDGIDGLVHVSDISWTQRIKHPSEQFSKGDDIEAVVLNFDTSDGEKPKISLGMKQLAEDPWSRILVDYPVGKVVSAKVQKMMDFGAFVELEPGIDGLVHVSESGDAQLSVGQEIRAEVVSVDPDERKIGLSVRSVQRRDALAVAQGFSSEDTASRVTIGDIFSKKHPRKNKRNADEEG